MLLCAACALALAGLSAWADDQPTGTAPAATAPAAVVPAGAQALSAKVEKVVGNVKWTTLDADAADPAVWQPVAVGMELPSGSQIKTSVRSQAVVRFGDETVALVESTSQVALMELYQTPQQDRVRLGLGYGAVRAGSADKGKKSKLTIETPNAVLSKEGTQGIRMSYNRGNGNYEVSLTQSGLLKVTNTLTGRSLSVAPHEFLTQAMVRWIEMEPFLRAPQMSDAFALAPNESLFSMQGGSSVFSNGGGATNGQNPVNIPSFQGLEQRNIFNQEINQQGAVTLGNTLMSDNAGAGIGPAGTLITGTSFFNLGTTGNQPAQNSNLELIIRYIRANPDIVAQYGVTVDQVEQYIRQHPEIVNNLTVQDLINYVNTGQIPSQFQTQRVKLAGTLKTRWMPLKPKNVGQLGKPRYTQPNMQNWMSSLRTGQKILKDKLFTTYHPNLAGKQNK